MNKKSLIYLSSSVMLMMPFITFASGKKLSDIITLFIGYLNQALFVLMGVAVIVFVYHIIKYFVLPNEDRKSAGNYVMYSVIGFFIVLSFWGLVNILQNTLDIRGDNQAPTWGSFSNLFPSGNSSGSQSPFSPIVVPAGGATESN